MRRTSLIASIVICVGLTATPGAQPPAPAQGTEQELIALDKQLAEAESKKDSAAVDKILASDYTLIDQKGVVKDRAHALSVLKSETGRVTMATSDYNVRVMGEVAIMTHASTIKGADAAAVEQLRATHVWVKRDGRWQLAADHCTTVASAVRPNRALPSAACSEASFAPEVQQFYGTPGSIQRKLQDASMQLERRRVYLLLVESDDSAQLTLFDRVSAEDPLVRVSQWQGASAGALREELSAAIMQNRGIACIGEQSKRMVLAKFEPHELARISAPITARAAFSHLLNVYQGQYIRTTVFLLC